MLRLLRLIKAFEGLFVYLSAMLSAFLKSPLHEITNALAARLWMVTRSVTWFFLPHSTPVDPNDRDMMLKIINSAINTKALSRWSSLACNIALDAVRTVELEENGRKEIDIKKYAKVEKVGVV